MYPKTCPGHAHGNPFLFSTSSPLDEEGQHRLDQPSTHRRLGCSKSFASIELLPRVICALPFHTDSCSEGTISAGDRWGKGAVSVGQPEEAKCLPKILYQRAFPSKRVFPQLCQQQQQQHASLTRTLHALNRERRHC